MNNYLVSHKPEKEEEEEEEDPIDARILEAARGLLRAHGPAFTMAQLADAADISRATLYRRVPSREALALRLRARGIEPGPALGDPARERIIEATRVLLDTHGLRFTIEEIAEQAEVGAATVYRSFGDREGLLRAFLEERTPRRLVSAQLRDLEAPVQTTLEHLVAALLRFVIEHPGLARIALLGESPEASELERLRRGGRSTFAQLVGYIEAQVERGGLAPVDPWLAASSLLGAVLTTTLLAPRLAAGSGRQVRTHPSPRSDDLATIDARARALVSLWLRGAGGAER